MCSLSWSPHHDVSSLHGAGDGTYPLPYTAAQAGGQHLGPCFLGQGSSSQPPWLPSFSPALPPCRGGLPSSSWRVHSFLPLQGYRLSPLLVFFSPSDLSDFCFKPVESRRWIHAYRIKTEYREPGEELFLSLLCADWALCGHLLGCVSVPWCSPSPR